MKKRILTLISAFLLMSALISTIALAAEETATSGSCGDDATWTFNEATKTLTISGTGAMSGTGQFHHPWSAYQDQIEHVIISEGITSISNHAFIEHKKLSEVTISSSVDTIEEGAFWFCESLNHIVIPATVTKFTDSRFDYEFGFGQPVFNGCPLTTAGPIGSGCDIEFGWTDSIPDSAFLCCPIESITLPTGIKQIGKAAFAYSLLTDVTIPDTVTNIGEEAFYSCRNLTGVSIPQSVIRINDGAFRNCAKLTNISVSSANTIYSSQDGMLLNKEMTELICCPGGKDTCEVPSSITTVKESAFYGCSSLTNIVLPDGLRSIGHEAFSGCSALTRIAIPGSVTSMGSGTFNDCTSLTDITLPGGVGFYGSWVFGGIKTQIKSIRITEGADRLDGTFSGFASLENVYLPSSITYIGENTFENCNNLKNVYYSGTQNQWNRIEIKTGNQEIGLAAVTCTGTALTPAPIPDIPTNPDQLNSLATQLGLLRFVNFDALDDTTLTRLELTELVAAMPGITIDSSKVDIPFIDCNELTNLQKAVIAAVVDAGIISGVGSNQFSPQSTMTRAQAVAIIWRALGAPSPEGSSDFLDVSVASWFAESLAALHEIGIIKTTSQYFYPNEAATRFDVVRWMCAASLYASGGEIPNIPDLPEPNVPDTLLLSVSNGGLGRKVTVQVNGGHWMTVQVRRAGAISISSIQVPGDGLASMSFSAPTGSSIQVWETEHEMSFTNGIPNNVILATAARTL